MAVRHREQQVKAPGQTRSKHEGGQAIRPTPNVDQILDDSLPASDPPSWTGSISRSASTPEREGISERLIRRIRTDYLEMPGLCITSSHAQRLWSVEPGTCEALLKLLVDSRFLRHTERDPYVQRRP